MRRGSGEAGGEPAAEDGSRPRREGLGREAAGEGEGEGECEGHFEVVTEAMWEMPGVGGEWVNVARSAMRLPPPG